MKTLLLFLIVIAFKAFANEPDVIVKSLECHGAEGMCGASDMQKAADLAKIHVKERFKNIANQAITNQAQACNNIADNFKNQCNEKLYNSIKIDIQSIQELMEQQTAQISSVNQMGKIEAQGGVDITGLAIRVEKLVSALKSSNESLAILQTELNELNLTCESKFNDVNEFCTEPVATSVGSQIEIYQNKSMNIMIAKTSATDSESYGEAEAKVQLQIEGKLEAPEIKKVRSSTQNEYYSTSRIGGDTNAQLTRSTDFAKTNVRQAELTLNSLSSLISTTNVNKLGEDCSAADEALGYCTEEETFTKAASAPVRPQARPDALSKLDAEDSEAESGAGSKKDSRQSSGLTAEQLSADANAKAYGTGIDSVADSGSSPSGTDLASSGTPKGSGSNGFGGNQIGQALGGLGSVFGKTGSSFGEEGYSPSSSARYNSPNSYSPSPAANLDSSQIRGNTNFRPNNGSTNTLGDANQPIPPRGNFANNLSPGSLGSFGGGGNGSGLPASSASAGGGPKAPSKPGLLSRLFGKKSKKDKTMFGKTDSANRNGSYGQSRTNSSRSFDRDSNSLNNTNNPQRRTFNAKDYEPTKAAQQRAYERATGRRIASSYNPNLQNQEVKWPADISLNKSRSLFYKMGLTVKDKIRDL